MVTWQACTRVSPVQSNKTRRFLRKVAERVDADKGRASDRKVHRGGGKKDLKEADPE